MEQAPLMLGVSGLRGLVGLSLTPDVACRYAASFGQWLKERKSASGGPPTVVMGRDSRPSGQMVELAAAAGLIGAGCRVVRLGIATTPGVAVMVDELEADGGMVITASHNPVVWNGIKCLRSDGAAPPAEDAAQIIDCYRKGAMRYVGVEELSELVDDATADQTHVARILENIDVELIRGRRLRVVLDSVHGAGGPSTALLLDRLGVELIHLWGETTGRFPHPPEPTRENLTALAEAVVKHKADAGLAQDPDADRLAIVDERGRYIGEEYTLALAVWHVLSRGKVEGAIPGALPGAAANLSTSRMIDDVVAMAGGGKVWRTPVGEANVAQAMRRHQAVIGGEGNGGVIWPAVIHVRDSLTGAALLLEMLAMRGQTVSQIVAGIPGYAIVKDKVDIRAGMAERVKELVKAKYAGQKVDLQDGVRVDWADRWVHVRPSNTEPILRIIAEAREERIARGMIEEIRGLLGGM
ncbi:MAG: phosphoglucosamine mutase [Phycisphaeraceae bacterium]|nr:phosphoglucosamine mutase [Phycisphaeraceae bacterium]